MNPILSSPGLFPMAVKTMYGDDTRPSSLANVMEALLSFVYWRRTQGLDLARHRRLFQVQMVAEGVEVRSFDVGKVGG
jgi:hypothetical protein